MFHVKHSSNKTEGVFVAEDKNETDKKDEQQAAAANVLPAELSKEMRTSFLE